MEDFNDLINEPLDFYDPEIVFNYTKVLKTTFNGHY